MQAQPAAAPAPTPPGCHWSDRGDGQATLWCKDAAGEFHNTGRLQAANLGVGDGCPKGQFYDGVQCIAALNAASSASRPRLTASEQAENRIFLTGLARSLDEVVTVDSAAWVVNHYDRGSMTGAKTLVHGSNRRSAVVYGEFTYNRGRRGWVKGRISNGQYTCLEYWDETGCRALGHPESHRVVAGLLLAMFAGAMSGGDSGGGSTSHDYLIQRPGQSAPEPSAAPMTPIGGDRGFYGADHSCCG